MSSLISLLFAAALICCAASAGPLPYRFGYPYAGGYASSYYLNGVVPPVAPFTAAKVAPTAPLVAPAVVPPALGALDYYNYATAAALTAPYNYYGNYAYPYGNFNYLWKK